MTKFTFTQKQRLKMYYERTQYDDKNKDKNLAGLFVNVQEIYNPVTDIVNATISSSVKDLSVENKKLNDEIWKKNLIQELSTNVCTDMYLYGECFVEAIIDANNEIEYIKHDFEKIEFIETEKGELTHFKVEGTNELFNEQGEPYTVEYTREYFRIEQPTGYKVIKKEIINGEETVTPFSLDIIPVSKFSYDSTIYEALNIIDRINENEAFIRSIFKIHGDPILQANNIESFADTTSDLYDMDGKKEAEKEQETLDKARYTRKTIIFTEDAEERKATFKYIELSNPLIKELQNDIARLKKDMIDLFPELILVDTTTQNVSSDTFEMKNSGLKSKVNSFRKAFISSLVDLDNIALMLSGSGERVTMDSYRFMDVFKEQDKAARLMNVEKALDILTKINELEMDVEFATNIEEIKRELINDINALYT